MSNSLMAKPHSISKLESVMLRGDLSELTDEERVLYHRNLCEAVGLNPMLKPFEYIRLNGKLTLYALKNATDQLRKIYSVSIDKIEKEMLDNGLYVVTAYGRLGNERKDTGIGCVNLAGLRGDALANAVMKAETKAKRRLTLSLCTLGMLDETEVETIPNAQPYVDSQVNEIFPDPEDKKLEPLRKVMHALGQSLYGSEWNTKRGELIVKIGEIKRSPPEKITSSNDLIQTELEYMISKMRSCLYNKCLELTGDNYNGEHMQSWLKVGAREIGRIHQNLNCLSEIELGRFYRYLQREIAKRDQQ